jgi:predicted alpha/beta hydrolase
VDIAVQALKIRCSDGVDLAGHRWQSARRDTLGTIVINPATGVRAGYYHYYARFLAAHGFDVITYDYRGIGLSRPQQLRGQAYDWHQWGERDFEAVLRHALDCAPDLPVSVVGHSIGGVLPGYAGSAPDIHRMLTMGAQFGYWRDYQAAHRTRLFWKWHVAMPMLNALLGYFPGRRLNWLEDLPSGVARQWGRGKGRPLPPSAKAEERDILTRFAAVTAPILAIGVTDDAFGTAAAINRALGYFTAAPATRVMLSPADLACQAIGHFDLFHARHAPGFWLDTLLWLRDGINPWPGRTFT